MTNTRTDAGGNAGRGGFSAVRLALAAAVMILLFAFPAAAADSSVIESVSITFTSTFQEDSPKEPDIKVETAHVKLDEIHYHRDIENWAPGMKVRTDLTFTADEGYYFSSNLNTADVKVSGANFVYAKARSDGMLSVSVNYVPVMILGNTSEAGWNSAHTMAIWKKVPYATKYKVQLYADDQKKSSFDVGTTFLDLSKSMTDKDKYYYYEVKAVPDASEKNYLKEGDFVTSNQDVVPDDSDSVNEGSASVNGNGVTLDAWRYENLNWYYIDWNGAVHKGWLLKDGSWYYLDPKTGIMATGWRKTDGGRWSFFTDSGRMASGWIRPTPNGWYFIGDDGYMRTGWIYDNGKWYWLDENSGALYTGWKLVNGTWYYFLPDGSMTKGWSHIEGKWYFMREGAMVHDETIDGYRLGSDGAMLNG